MNLYELAKQVKPEQLADHQSKVIWKGSNGTFSYLIRLEDIIYLRMSFSIVQLGFYIMHLSGWGIVSKSEYLEVVELWQEEKTQLGKMQSSGQSSFL